MRPQSTVIDTTIQIETHVALDAEGQLVVVTTTTSHGNAKYTSLARLQDTGDSNWVVFERNNDGSEVVALVEDTKAEAIRKFAQRATARAARWAVSS